MLHQACTGVDVGKDTLDVALALDGSRFQTRKFGNDKKGFEQAWLWLCSLAPDGFRTCLEATSAYHKALCAFFEDKGSRLLVLNPKQARDLARGLGLLRKDDATDARGSRFAPRWPGASPRPCRTLLPASCRSSLGASTC